jgi:hypothetical protein
MSVKLTTTKTTYVVELTTKVLFTDEYDTDLKIAPQSAEVFTINGELDKIDLIGDDEDGMQTAVYIRDIGRLSGYQTAVISRILAACNVKAW